ncbi:MAG: Ig-like domain-containing protein [Kiritimatiellota bacterium]|nr:Ig-like domain-containing protein [Kiritimatiellota bacterium]
MNFSQVAVSHSAIRYSRGDGIYGWSGGLANITDTTFTNNRRYAAMFDDGSMNPVLARLSATGNGYDGVGLGGGTMAGAHTWEYTGIPYIVTGDETVDVGASLTVQPGTEVRFQQYAGLTSWGKLAALGTASQPITFTGQFTTPVAGWWDGISIKGSQSAPNNAGATFDYTTIEYGGGGYETANLYVNFSQVAVSHSAIRYSGGDGVYAFYGGAGSNIQSSQIVSNAGFGMRNGGYAVAVLLAANNWWGAATGPTITDSPCNPNGTGSRVGTGVAFLPFLTSPDADPGPVAPSETAILTLTPTRWFAPADGISRIYITATLRDGTGLPLPGRTVRLATTRGSAVSGGVTDVQGRTFAYVTSNTVGESELTAQLDAQTACETTRSAIANVNFTSITDGAGALLPESAAPYLNGGIEIDPMPIVRGVRTVLRARLTNSNNVPILVDATFGVAQSGIGLTFGPVGQVSGQRIAANSTGVIEVVWTPLVSGHVCVQLQYSARQDNGAASAPTVLSFAAGGSGRAQRNLNVYPGSLGSSGKNDALDKADKAFRGISKIPSGPTKIQKALLGRWWQWARETARKISQALGGDPPRQDYKTISTAVRPIIPPTQAGTQISAARAAAINAVDDALADAIANGNAAVIAFDRYGGAAEAQDQSWSSQQAAAQIFFTRAFGTAMITLADKLDAFMQVLQNEGEPDFVVSADEFRAYQDRLRAPGFTADEINDAKQVGLTDADIEAIRQDTLATDPASVAGSYLAKLADESAKARSLGNTLLNPWDFGGGLSIGVSAGQAGNRVTANSNNLARVYETVSSIQVGNPLTQTATINMNVRRVDLPSDWMVTTTPVSVTLPAGGQTTVNVAIEPGSATVQNTRPRVAVEAYANNQLLGGVVLDVAVPQAVQFDGKLRVYVPAAYKSFSGAW